MGLVMQKRSKWWYGRIKINGKEKYPNLGVEIKGSRPKTLKSQGDLAFERSRGKAQAVFDQLEKETKQKRANVELLQTIHEARTGARASTIKLKSDDGMANGIFEAWLSIPRTRQPSKQYIEETKSFFTKFCNFLSSEYPEKTIEDMSSINATMAEAFMASEEKRGITGKTYNNKLILLRSTFDKLKKKASIFDNPFEEIPTKEDETVFREPYSIDELAAICEVARRKEHSFIRPIIFTGISTAMRRGDCCLLEPAAVDFENRFVKVKTGKTHKLAEIPMFPLLHEELKRHCKIKKGQKYMFPKQAEMYKTNPDGITLRVKQVLKNAGYYDKKKDDDTNHKSNVHKIRTKGLRNASIRDFHSFKVSWVTLALTSGVELELVKKVTGNKTVDVVLKHYFQPGREDFRNSLEDKMPDLLMNGSTRNKHTSDANKLVQRIQDIASEMNASNVTKLSKEIVNIISKSTVQK